ncbi:OmpH family outer membrane protein [Ascidiaceihabitans sp.]|nr:OmpH family outer membrane protein [Ascidiaceihabitans sp.]
MGHVNAQQIEFSAGRTLVVDTLQLFNKSQFGIRAAQQLEIQGAQLAEENKGKEIALSEEEKQLTALRATMTAEKFRILADEFDQKVQTTREEQLAKTQALSMQIETQRNTFLNAAAPILQALMLEVGATVLLERRNVVLSTNTADITAIAIAQIDGVLSDGSQPATSVD